MLLIYMVVLIESHNKTWLYRIEVGWNIPRKAESRIRYSTMLGKPLLKCQFRLLTYRWILGK